MTVSEPGAPSANVHQEKTEPSFVPSFRIIDLDFLLASCRQVLAIRRKSSRQNAAKHIVSPAISVIEVTERMTPPTVRGVGCEPS